MRFVEAPYPVEHSADACRCLLSTNCR